MEKSLEVINESTCKECGACCFANDRVPHTDEEWNKLPDIFKKPLLRYYETLTSKYLSKKSVVCPWYSVINNTCLHYDYRPQQCRDWKVGGLDCRNLRDWVKQRV